MASDSRLVAERYVEALFELGQESKASDALKADMLMLKSIVHNSAEFQKLLVSPVVSRIEAEKAVAKVLTAAGACDLTRKFFALLARNRRLALAPIAIDSYLKRLAESRGELTVHVTAAQELDSEEAQAITGAIAKSTGKKITLEISKNPDLIGGMQVRVGSQMLDNSVAGKLSRLKQSLKVA